jgi:HlyD family secretion protein
MTRNKFIIVTKPSLVILLLVGSIMGCDSAELSDAYGQFEAVETTVSAEVGGELVGFGVNEGDRLEPDQVVGLIDTAQLALKRQEIQAQLEATQARIVYIDAQTEVLEEQLETARTDLERIQRLAENQAATEKQLDDALGQVQIIQKQIRAQSSQKQSIHAEVQAVKARLAQISEQIQDAKIINPIRGTVLTAYVDPHELVQPGQQLYQIAALDTLELRVYVSGAQLPHVKIGQPVQVFVDENAEENRQLSGRVTWIASEAEFTPKMIQTKEERVTQVYAVKVRVPNPHGNLKVGMPAEVNFSRGSSQIKMD